MNTALSLIRACADAEPGDLLPYLIAADFFDNPDEGNDTQIATALRWMAEHGKYPALSHNNDSLFPTHYHWYPEPFSFVTDPTSVWPEHARVPILAPHTYYSWLAAVIDLYTILHPA